ncbi:MAG: hypothetical protein WC629_01260 [Candidatus Paceibacterota bacterium]|jgi:hypothetical protein
MTKKSIFLATLLLIVGMGLLGGVHKSYAEDNNLGIPGSGYAALSGTASTGSGSSLGMTNAEAAALEKGNAEIKAKPENCQVSWLGAVTGLGFINMSFNCMIAQISNKVLGLSSWVLWAAGLIFQFTLGYSLDMKKFIDSLDIITVGWKIFRDIANICFIFILLAIAIGTILRIDSYNVKKTLATVVIAALLLNFSLFFTKVVIDASNILALQFYSQIVVNGKALSINPVTNAANWADNGLSSAMMKALGIESIYSDPNNTSGDNSLLKKTETQGVTVANIIIIGFMGSVLILAAAFVFFAGAILFVIRTVVLIFLMILSPLAFMCLALPSLKKHFSTWQGRLMNEAIFAPAYMIMIWIVFKALGTNHKTIDGKTMNFASFITGSSDAVGTIYTFIVLIAFMLGSLLVAKHFGASGGDFARNVAGKASFGAAGWMGRQTLGRAFNKASNSEMMQSWKNSGGLGIKSRVAGFVDSRAKGTYDFRNTGIGKETASRVGGLGTAGGVGGFQKASEDQKKRSTDAARQGIIRGKKEALNSALASGNVAGIQTALNNFTDSEYKELDSSLLTNSLVVQNSRHSQIKAVLDEKHEKLNASQKEKIRTHRLQELNEALSGRGGRSVGDILDGMDDGEKANLPEGLISNPQIFIHLGKGVQESIAKRDDLTPIQKKAIGDAKNLALETAAAAPAVGGNDRIIKGVIKGMGSRGLLSLHNRTGILTNPAVAKYLSVSQLKELGDMGGVNNASVIGGIIDGDQTAAGHKYMKTQDARALWI